MGQLSLSLVEKGGYFSNFAWKCAGFMYRSLLDTRKPWCEPEESLVLTEKAIPVDQVHEDMRYHPWHIYGL